MTSIEVTFLGTTACIPTRSRNHPALYIRYTGKEESRMLFDCGEGTQRQILSAGLNFMSIDNIFITHWHADHFAGLLGLMGTMNLENRERPLNIFGPEATKFVDIILSLGYWAKNFDVIPHDVNFEGTEIQKIVDSIEYEVLAIPVKHSIPAVAYAVKEKNRIRIDKNKAKKLGLPSKGVIYRMLKEKGAVEYKGKKVNLKDIMIVDKGKKVAYSGDTLPCENMVRLAKDAELLIHDATFFDDEERLAKHTSLEDVIKIAKSARAKRTVLTHISRRYQDVRELQDKIRSRKNFTLAKDFMKITV